MPNQLMNGPSSDMTPPGNASPNDTNSPPNVLSSLSLAHGQAKAQNDKINQTAEMLKATRAELDKLVSMGTAITDEDVLQGMSKLVAAGADPKTFIGLMAGNPTGNPPTQPMPESGEALAAWISQQDQMVKAQESAIGPAQQTSSHQVGVTALQYLAGHHMMSKVGNGPAVPSTLQ